jgi:hypothetical protein
VANGTVSGLEIIFFGEVNNGFSKGVKRVRDVGAVRVELGEKRVEGVNAG